MYMVAYLVFFMQKYNILMYKFDFSPLTTNSSKIERKNKPEINGFSPQ